MKLKFYRKILKNGMTILFEKRNIPVVSVAFAVKAGGVNETKNEKGISHFIEHMLYKGTPTRNAQKIAEEIERNGGDLNGFTDELITAYWCKMPSKHLNTALEVLSDMVKNPLFDKKELEKERKVIFEEIKMRKDNPMIHVFDEIQSYLYDGTLGIPLIGNYDTLYSIDREKIVKKFEQIYQPNNMVLCVVGDADFNKIVKFAEDNFGNEKGKVPELKVGLKNKIKIKSRKGIDQANLVFAYHVPLTSDKKSHTAKVLSTLMAEGMSSKLFSEIRMKRNLAYAVKGGSNTNKDFAYNFVYVGTEKKNVGAVKELILEEFKKVSENLGEKELKQVKEQMIGNHYINMEDSQNQMANLLFYEIEGSANDFYNLEKNIRNVKLKDVKELAKKATKKYSFFALVPE
ncbi:protease 3 precursor [archaeon BMS3Abin17]|nr:protease 3 precursor [archaeon BMS3Abin17]HDZ60774.1 insulinase family protein [Candidatus Pacearchaeota archaeon]